MNVAVIFYSRYGATGALAAAVADGAKQASATVRLLRAPELVPGEPSGPAVRLATVADLLWAHAVAFGSPSRYGALCAQIRRLLDEAATLKPSGRLAGKMAGVFCPTIADKKAQDATLVSMITPLLRLGFTLQGSIAPDPAEPLRAAASGDVDLPLARALGRRLAVAAARLVT